jgi:hypothetical protein
MQGFDPCDPGSNPGGAIMALIGAMAEMAGITYADLDQDGSKRLLQEKDNTRRYRAIWKTFLRSLDNNSYNTRARALEKELNLEDGLLNDQREYWFARDKFCRRIKNNFCLHPKHI